MMSTEDVAAACGVSNRQIDHWVRKGYISASHPASGSGSQRRFSVQDAIDAACLATLVRFGIRPNVATVIMQNGGCLEGGDVLVRLDVVAVRARLVEILGEEATLRLV